MEEADRLTFCINGRKGKEEGGGTCFVFAEVKEKKQNNQAGWGEEDKRRKRVDNESYGPWG